MVLEQQQEYVVTVCDKRVEQKLNHFSRLVRVRDCSCCCAGGHVRNLAHAWYF